MMMGYINNRSAQPRGITPKTTELSPATKARLQKLTLRISELVQNGMDYQSASAKAYTEATSPNIAIQMRDINKPTGAGTKKKQPITFEQIEAFASGKKVFTAYGVWEFYKKKHAYENILAVLNSAISDGKLELRLHGGARRYCLVEKQ